MPYFSKKRGAYSCASRQPLRSRLAARLRWAAASAAGLARGIFNTPRRISAAALQLLLATLRRAPAAVRPETRLPAATDYSDLITDDESEGDRSDLITDDESEGNPSDLMRMSESVVSEGEEEDGMLAPGINCRKRWKNLKDQCRKEMRKNPNESDWPHFQKLKFIHNQFLADDEECDEDTVDEVFDSLDESIKRPKLGYTMRKKLLMNKRRTLDVDLNKLITLVQAKELIWNRQLKGHHNWYKLDESWKEISQELGVTRDEARLKWKYLRDQARKEVRKQQSDWEYLPRLQFLINQFNDFEGPDTADDHFSQDFDTSTDQTSNYYIEPTPQTTHTPVPETPVEVQDVSVKDDEFDEFDTKPIIMETDFCDDDDDIQRSAGNSTDAPEATKDEDIGFFNSLIPHVKKLGPAKKLMLRMKIQELVYNTVYNET